MQLDCVRRDTRLPVLVVEEGDPDHARPGTDPRENHGKVIERRRGTSARKRALSQLANDAVLKRELSSVQIEFDDHPKGPRERL